MMKMCLKVMMRRVFLLVILFMSVFVSGYSETGEIKVIQNEQMYVVADTANNVSALEVSYLANPAKDNWFIGVSCGYADLMSEESRYVPFTESIKPVFGLSVGRWISPVWGLRLNVTTSRLRGFTLWNDETETGFGTWYIGKNHPYPGQSKTNSYLPAFEGGDRGTFIKERFLSDPVKSDKGSGYTYYARYGAASVDFLVNLNYLFGAEYKKDRLFEIYAYGGMGLAHVFGDQKRDQTDVNCIMEKMGMTLNFRLSDKWSVNADSQFLVLPEYFDWRMGDGNTHDIVANCTLGLTYNFGSHNLKHPRAINSLTN